MFKLRRSVLLYLIFMFGLLLGQLESRLIFILGVPLLIVLIMARDDVSYNKNSIKLKRGH